MRFVIVFCLVFWVGVFVLLNKCSANEWSIGYMAASWHKSSDYKCFNERRNYNEIQNGLYVKYKALTLGRYENSKSGCAGAKYSNFIGLEAPLWSVGQVDFSVMGAIADGYPNDDDSDFGEYQPAASLNAQWEIFKVFYGYKVAAISLQWDFK